MSGWKKWQQLEVVTQADLQNYIQDQVVQVYANSAARGSALGVDVTPGMVSYLQDTQTVEVRKNLGWEAVGGGGTANPAWATSGTAGYSLVSSGTADPSWQPVSHNYIINGAFDIWQRGTSFTSSGVYTADRFRQFHDGSGVSKTISRQTFSPNALNVAGFGEEEFFFRYQVTSAGTSNTYHFVDVLVEDVRTLAGQTATLSFWAKSAATSPIQANIIQNFGSGGSSEVDTTFVSLANTSTSWNRFIGTITIPSISGKTVGAGSHIYIRFSMPANTTFTMDLWGVQLEAGSVATPFKRNANSLQAELAACQRYYWQPKTHTSFTAYSFSSTLTYCTVNLPVTMRATPTFTLTNADIRISTPSGDLIPSATASVLTSTSSIMFSATQTYTAGRGALMFPTTDTAIQISAEL